MLLSPNPNTLELSRKPKEVYIMTVPGPGEGWIKRLSSSSKLLTGREVSEVFGIPLATVYEHARTGLLPCVRIGRHVRFNPSDLAAFIADGGCKEAR